MQINEGSLVPWSMYVDVGLAIHTGRFSMPQVVGEGWTNLHIYSTLFCMLFDTLFYLNLLRHCQRLTHYYNVTTRVGWNWYVFTVKLLNVYSISFISGVFLLISSTARFEFLHLCRWRCVLHL